MRTLLINLLTRYPALAWVLAAIGVVLLIAGEYQLHAFKNIQQNGIVTQGTVTAFKPDSDKAVDMEYAYTVNGKQYAGTNSVGVHDQQGLAPGVKLEVKYLKDDPAQSVTGKSWPSTPYVYLMGGGILVLFPFAMARRRRWLARHSK